MISQTRLKEVLYYHPESGDFVWLEKLMVRTVVGQQAGSIQFLGYNAIKIDKKLYRAGRLAWFYMTGGWPRAEIDHVNGDRADDRWANLRQASRSENNGNTRRRRDNSTGFKGVSLSEGKYVARIGGKYLGSFGSAHEASVAYMDAARARYGEFANGG